MLLKDVVRMDRCETWVYNPFYPAQLYAGNDLGEEIRLRGCLEKSGI